MSETDENRTVTVPTENSEDDGAHRPAEDAVGPMDDASMEEQTEADQKDEEYRASRRCLGPGDEGYDPSTDKIIPNSVLVDQVRIEMSHSDGKASPTWEALYAEWEKKNPEEDETEDENAESGEAPDEGDKS